MQALGNLSMGLAFLGMVLGLILGGLTNLIARRRLINPGTLAYIGVGLAAATGFSIVVTAMARSSNANPDAFKEGELFGSVVGGVLIPLIITFFIHRSLKRKSAAA